MRPWLNAGAANHGRRLGAALFIRSLKPPVLSSSYRTEPHRLGAIVSRHILLGQHEDLHVGTCWAGCDEVADRGEE